MTETLTLIGRDHPLFREDIAHHSEGLTQKISNASFLVLGGAGSIGQAVVKEIFKRNPKKIHVVDISENNLVELVRDLRSEHGHIQGDFQTFALDIGSAEYDAFFNSDGRYDYILNLSALKHVRSEKDPFTLMRMLDVNIFNTDKTLQQAIEKGIPHYFCVSTDKAAAPANLMGASKRVMELFLMRRSQNIRITTARFANVAFSDGSLLHGFKQRINKQQPIVAPIDVQRYFLTPEEAGELCLMACILGGNCEIYFPKPSSKLPLTTFSSLAEKYLAAEGFKVYQCETEQQARDLSTSLPSENQWPCLFTTSDTTGEKPVEEFYTSDESPNMGTYREIGIIENNAAYNAESLDTFTQAIKALKKSGHWTKTQIIEALTPLIPNFNHLEKGKYLDSKM